MGLSLVSYWSEILLTEICSLLPAAKWHGHTVDYVLVGRRLVGTLCSQILLLALNHPIHITLTLPSSVRLCLPDHVYLTMLP